MAAPVGPSRYLVEVILVSESAVPGLTVHQRLYLNNPPDYKVSIQWISQFSGLSELWVERFGLNDATKVLNCLKCLQMLREWLHRERELYTWRGLAWLSEWVPLSLNCRSRLVYLSLIKSYDLTFDSWFRCLQFFLNIQFTVWTYRLVKCVRLQQVLLPVWFRRCQYCKVSYQ